MDSGEVLATKSFKVIVRKEEVVAPLLPLQEHWLPMSNLDLLLPPLDFGLFFCYKKPAAAELEDSINNVGANGISTSSVFGVLKKAMAQALLPYYAFAGEVVKNSSGEPELQCSNRGVDFVEAFAEVELEELNFYNPDHSVEGKLVPKKSPGRVLAVQATELKCGGVVVGCSFDHRVADAYSANMFLVSWAELARSKPITHFPSFRRSLLNPRRPGLIDPAFEDMYVPAMPPPPEDPLAPPTDHLISRIYHVKADDLNKLQALASSNDRKRSKLESFSAYLWKLVAKSSQYTDAEKPCRIGIVVDGRKWLSEGENKAMDSYFGNVLSVPFTGKKVSELVEEPLSEVAAEVHESLEAALTKEHFLGLIDWVEALRPVPGMTRIYSYRREDGPSFVVSSGQRFPVSDVDFGWGRPFFGSYHFPWGGDCGYVMPMPSPGGNGDWVVYMHLFRWQLEVIEKVGSQVFKPLTFDYLINCH
ncbi:coniferyl alcohol acyltransferase-like [Humulus lupulus]|uniref:coniferyl alcohol acyltransferase-like n=1 Tax=Humulus lupulus TaxID=3486 RepID=UPI002B4184AB|nr:coniferyl alcohol acyltransferase-like [Humulus lupulus]